MLINYFLFLLGFLLLGGLALDGGLLEARRMNIQQAADAAAQEAMYVYARGDNTYATAGQAEAAVNGFTNGVNGVTVSIVNPPTGGTYTGNSWAVQATVSQTVKTIFMGLVGSGTTKISASAVAEVLPTCIWTMDSGANSTNGTLQIASANLSSTCGVYVNSGSYGAGYVGNNIRADGFASLNVAGNRIRVVGPSSGNLSTGSVSPLPKFGAAGKMDPLAYETAPASPTTASCQYNSVSHYGGGPYTLNPGIYCGGIDIAYTTVNLNPGLYIIAGGLSAASSYIYGTGVTLYFTKKTTDSTYAPITVSGPCCSISSYGLFLKAPTTSGLGGVPGVVMFGDRNWIDHGNQDVQFAFATVETDGYWYFLNTGLYTWETYFHYYKYNGLVVDNYYQFGSTNTFASDFSDLGGISPLHYEDGVLVQ